MIERLAVRPLSDALQALADLGCEFASIYRSLRCAVTLVEKRERLVHDWDESIGAFIAHALRSAGVTLHLGQELDFEHPGGTSEEPSFAIAGGLNISSDLALVATGRKPNIEISGSSAGTGLLIHLFESMNLCGLAAEHFRH